MVITVFMRIMYALRMVALALVAALSSRYTSQRKL